MTESPAFRTDRYEFTMVDAAIQSGTADRECMFEAFARHLPAGRRYGIVAGTGRLLDLIRQFRFTDAELDWLRENNVVRQPTLDWLADYSFHGNVWATAFSNTTRTASTPSSSCTWQRTRQSNSQC